MIKRCELNPILSAKDIPYNAALIFNAGVAKIDGEYYMLFRNDYASLENPRKLCGTNLGLARSKDGIHWVADPQPCFAMKTEEIERIYDPRIQVIDGEIYLCFAVDTKHGIRGGIAKTDKEFKKFEVLSLSAPDNRNMVLFPEKINGKFARLERPFPVYSMGYDKFDIWYSDSPDMKYWGNTQLVLGAEKVPYANAKIGPAAPPIKTKYGWLTTFHAVRAVEPKKNGWENLNRFFEHIRVGIKVFDEAHLHFKSIMKVDLNTNVYKTFYLTATFERTATTSALVTLLSTVISYSNLSSTNSIS